MSKNESRAIPSILLTLFFLLTVQPSAVQGLQVRDVEQRKIPVLNLPDLVIDGFSIVESTRAKVGNVISFGYTASVKNIGTADVTATFYVSIEKYSPTANRWEPSGLYRNQNCFPLMSSLGAGQTRSFSRKLYLLDTEISNQTVRLRAVIDAACNEELPPTWAHIKEIREDNNFSNEAAVPGGYYPAITGISKTECIKGMETIYISGHGFDSTPGLHTVALRPVTTNVYQDAIVTQWNDGAVYFQVPPSFQNGAHLVAILDKNSRQKLSNERNVLVLERRTCPWEALIDLWESTIKNAMSVRIHTSAGGCNYNNQSTLTLIQTFPLTVDRIQFHRDRLGDYRYVVRDLNSASANIRISRNPAWTNKLQLEIPFESDGVETKGCFQSIAGGGWVDGSAPDIHINNARMSIFFDLTFDGNTKTLDYTVNTGFHADLQAAKEAADWLMNLFLNNWQSSVRDRVNQSVRNSMSTPSIRQSITSSLIDMFRTCCLNYYALIHITNIEFSVQGIHLTYWD
ncbi:MAG: hypothetical protein OEW05_00830 [Candidatus Aminicenantes bacterium]|nr:hypothetical protein [Candidatus Aminicenantes bacterium]